MGDGECYEGSVWEAAMFANHHNLDNLIAIVDPNNLTVFHFTKKIIKLNPFVIKMVIFWLECIGSRWHNINEIHKKINYFKKLRNGKPSSYSQYFKR